MGEQASGSTRETKSNCEDTMGSSQSPKTGSFKFGGEYNNNTDNRRNDNFKDSQTPQTESFRFGNDNTRNTAPKEQNYNPPKEQDYNPPNKSQTSKEKVSGLGGEYERTNNNDERKN